MVLAEPCSLRACVRTQLLATSLRAKAVTLSGSASGAAPSSPQGQEMGRQRPEGGLGLRLCRTHRSLHKKGVSLNEIQPNSGLDSPQRVELGIARIKCMC